MTALRATQIKAFVPAKDFETSLAFYADLGFGLIFRDDGLAGLNCGDSSFLLQRFFVAEHAHNFMMHLLVDDVQAWRRQVLDADLVGRYGVRVTEVVEQSYHMRDFTLTDPTGVLWIIGENLPGGLSDGVDA